MKRTRDRPTRSFGRVHEQPSAGVVALATGQSAIFPLPIVCHPTMVSDQAQVRKETVIPFQSVSRPIWQQSSSFRFPHPDHLQQRPRPHIFEGTPPQVRRYTTTEGRTRSYTLSLAHFRSAPSEWQWLHRFVSLSRLGWAFVLTAIFWEIFAYAFSHCTGWGWNKGAFFFIWGLGVLAFGFYLRTSRKRTSVSPLFLGVNILVVSVLSLIVATR